MKTEDLLTTQFLFVESISQDPLEMKDRRTEEEVRAILDNFTSTTGISLSTEIPNYEKTRLPVLCVQDGRLTPYKIAE